MIWKNAYRQNVTMGIENGLKFYLYYLLFDQFQSAERDFIFV